MATRSGSILMAGAKDVEKGETTNLLGETTKLLADPLKHFPGLHKKDPPVIAYDPEQLTNWRAIVVLQGTIFKQKAVIGLILTQFTVALAVGLALYHFTSNPEAYKMDAMDGIVKTIAVTIAFMLGMFLSACVNRWWDTVKSLEKLFGTIKRLVMTCINLELSNNVREIIARQCCLSTRLLQVELTENHMVLAGKQSKADCNANWLVIFDEWLKDGIVTEEELSTLRRAPNNQRSFFAWSLVSQELIHQRKNLVSEDGHADVMAYDRLCDLVQDGVGAVSAVRTAAAFQMPYIYVHMLAFMIHFVNLLTAIGTGVKIGLLFASAGKKHVPVDVGELASALVFLGVQAFIYQAFLTIGAALSFPITGEAYRIPFKAMVEALDAQLKLMNQLADDFNLPMSERSSRHHSQREEDDKDDAF